MFERFTERARQVVVLAQDEARAFRHNYIGTWHLILGLLREEEGVAARALESFDVTLEDERLKVAKILGEGDHVAVGQVPFSPRAQQVLEMALREALSLGHNHIGTEHILLAVVRDDAWIPGFDATPRRIAERVVALSETKPPPGYLDGFAATRRGSTTASFSLG